jgi:DNA-binding transcriptional LysR family regulator
VARRIFASYGGLLASPAYLATHGAPADLGELAEHECVTQPPETGNFAIWRLQGPDGAEEEVRVRGRFTSNVQVALREAACAGLGIVALPTILTAAEVAAGRLVPVLPGYMRAGRGLSVVYPSRQQRPLAVSAFVDMAVEKLSLREWTPSSGASIP